MEQVGKQGEYGDYEDDEKQYQKNPTNEKKQVHVIPRWIGNLKVRGNPRSP